MSEKLFPATKPTPSPTAATNGNAAAAAPATNPAKYRPPYRPQPYNARTRRLVSKRNICCCCVFWSVLVILLLLLVGAIASAALYMLYHPRRPNFSVDSLRIRRLNITTDSSGAAAGHLVSLLNLTLTSKNPNSHISFVYDQFSLSAVAAAGDVSVGNGTLPAFVSGKKNETTFRNVAVASSADLDAEALNSLRSSERRRTDGGKGLALKLVLDTRVVVNAGKLKSKKVGIRVTCDGIRGVVPTRGPTLAVTTEAKCKADVRIKIWRFTF